VSGPDDLRYCPECGAEYRPGFTRCYDCDVELVDRLPVEDDSVEPEEGDAPRLVEVFAASHVEADLVRAALLGHGIPAVLARPDQSAAYPLTVGAMGEGRVLVPEDRGQEALEVIGTLDEDEDEDEAEPEVLAAPKSRDADWWIAVVAAAAVILIVVAQVRN
jgi:hypothetical protein